jgi:ribosomal protein S8
MINNILADSITRIKNGYTSNLDSVDLKRSNYMVNIIKVLYNEGFI